MEGKNSIARVAAYFMRYRFLFVLNMFLALASTAFEISIPKIIQFVIDEIIMVNQIRWLWLGLAAIVTAYFLRDALNYLRIRLNNVIEQRVLIDLRAALHRKLMHLPVGFFDERKTGDISSRVTEDVLNVEGAILDGTETRADISFYFAWNSGLPVHYQSGVGHLCHATHSFAPFSWPSNTTKSAAATGSACAGAPETCTHCW